MKSGQALGWTGLAIVVFYWTSGAVKTAAAFVGAALLLVAFFAERRERG